MKILILSLLLFGLSQTKSAAVTKNIVDKSKVNSSKIESTPKLVDKDILLKNEKAKRETSSSSKIPSEEEKNLKLEEASDLKEVERAKKSCQLIRAYPNSPTKICMEFNGPTSSVSICDNNGQYPYRLQGQYEDNSLTSNYLNPQYSNPSSMFVDPSSTSPYDQSPLYSSSLLPSSLLGSSSLLGPSSLLGSSPLLPSTSLYSSSPSYPSSSYPSSSLFSSSSMYPSSSPYQFLVNSNPLSYISSAPKTDYNNDYSQNPQGSLPYYLSGNPNSDSSYPGYNTGNYAFRPSYGSSGGYSNYIDPTSRQPVVKQCTCKFTPISSLYSSGYGRSNSQLETSTPTEAVNILPTVTNALTTDTLATESSTPSESENSASSAISSSARTAIISPTSSYRLISPKALIGLTPVYRVAANPVIDGTTATLTTATNPRSDGTSAGLTSSVALRPVAISTGVATPQISRQYTQPQDQMHVLNTFGTGIVQGPRFYRKLEDSSDGESTQDGSLLPLAAKNHQKRSQEGQHILEEHKNNDEMLKNYQTQNSEAKQFFTESTRH